MFVNGAEDPHMTRKRHIRPFDALIAIRPTQAHAAEDGAFAKPPGKPSSVDVRSVSDIRQLQCSIETCVAKPEGHSQHACISIHRFTIISCVGIRTRIHVEHCDCVRAPSICPKLIMAFNRHSRRGFVALLSCSALKTSARCDIAQQCDRRSGSGAGADAGGAEGLRARVRMHVRLLDVVAGLDACHLQLQAMPNAASSRKEQDQHWGQDNRTARDAYRPAAAERRTRVSARDICRAGWAVNLTVLDCQPCCPLDINRLLGSWASGGV